jgi:hypothetical protein
MVAASDAEKSRSETRMIEPHYSFRNRPDVIRFSFATGRL